MTNESIGPSAEIAELLRELIAWTRFQALPGLKKILETELSEDRKRVVYELTDGSRAGRDVGDLAGVPSRTVHNWWERWFELGIVKQSRSRPGRMERLCSLKDVGIEVSTPRGKEIIEQDAPAG